MGRLLRVPAALFALELLGLVLSRARETMDRSPEQVGAVVGVSGRTIRRLEEGEGGRPRRVTLDSLANFYGLNPEFLEALAAWSDESAGEVRALLVQWSSGSLGADVAQALADEPEELAVRASRSRSTAADGASGMADYPYLVRYLKLGVAGRERDEGLALMADYFALDSSRRRLVREIVGELRRAQRADTE